MLTFAMRDRVITTHPARGATMLKEHNEREVTVTHEEFGEILEKAPDWAQPIIALAYWTGMRLSEATLLRWDQVDLRAGFIRIRTGETKNNDWKSVPLPAPAVELLRRVPRPIKGGGRVFKARPDSISKVFSKAAKAVGLADVRFHNLRHTAATRWADAGIDEALIMKAVGQKTRSMFRRYRAATEKQLRRIADVTPHEIPHSDKKSDAS